MDRGHVSADQPRAAGHPAYRRPRHPFRGPAAIPTRPPAQPVGSRGDRRKLATEPQPGELLSLGLEQAYHRGQAQASETTDGVAIREMANANPPQRSWAPPWWAVFIIGLLLWGAAIGVTLITGNVITLPTIVLIGSFLVPVTGVVWYLDHDPSPALSPRRITAAFIIAGTLGVLAASLLEYYLVGTGLLANFEVGLVEELVKTLMVVAVAWGIHSFHTRDGMVLGAAVGFGFAALESSGYALASLFVVQGQRLFLSLDSVVVTELVRGILAPFGHGMWTAIVAGTLFAAARARGRGRRYIWILGA